MKNKIIYILLSVSFLFGCKQKQEPVKKDPEKKPNFLFVVVDDQSALDLKLYNKNSILDTPTINSLAANGVTITNAKHMGAMVGAVCTPSRHMIMTGKGLWDLPSMQGYTNPNPPKDLEKQSLAALFNNAGYNTMRTCKKGNSYPKANKEFAYVKDATKRGGTETSGSAWHADQVLDYLKTRKEAKEEKPFFIYFGFSHPHDTRNGTPELLAKYGATNHKDINEIPVLNHKQPPLPDNYLKEHPFHHGHIELRDEERVSGVWKNRDEATVRNELGREYACSENIDIQLQRVLAKLKATGELENTYIIYTSDHGIALGGHGLMGKQNLYEHSWRVPLIVKGPGVKENVKIKGNVYLLDLLPTVCDLAGISIPNNIEGKSFKPLLLGKKNTLRDVMYGVYAGGSKPGIRSVTKGDWKLIKYDLLDGSVQKTQLFNLKENPNEYIAEHHRKNPMETNLAHIKKYKTQQLAMEKLLQEQMTLNNDPYTLWDQTTSIK